ncbi:MAG: HlyD family type I secretion periplasmic adaptor subunit [Sphingomonas sp.]
MTSQPINHRAVFAVRKWRDQDGARQVILVSAAGLLLFLLWAGFTQVDEITKGQGRVIPSSKVQLIQSADSARIASIAVRAGQRVHKGELLVRMDNTESSAALGQVVAEGETLAARAARLSSEASGAKGSGCPVGADGKLALVCDDEAALKRIRAQALESKMSGLRAAIEQRRRDMTEAEATSTSLQNSIALQQKQVDMLAPLAAKSIVPQTELLNARRELVDLQGRLAASREARSRAAAAVQEATSQATEADLHFRQETLDERSQLAGKLAVNAETLRGAQGKLARAEIRSPVEGVVNDVQVTTLGGYVNAGQKIMEVVPFGDKLLVEARVKPSDIAFIRIGDKAVIKVTAYDFSIYGGLDGRVVQVSADSIYDEQTKEAYFNVVVETDRAYLLAGGGRQLPITPGMVCEAEIVTGRKSILDYLLKPVLKARSDAMRER